jgi:hypothetical protein
MGWSTRTEDVQRCGSNGHRKYYCNPQRGCVQGDFDVIAPVSEKIIGLVRAQGPNPGRCQHAGCSSTTNVPPVGSYERKYAEDRQAPSSAISLLTLM